MDMIDEELARLKNRLDDLRNRIISNLDSKAQQVYAQVMSMPKDSEKRLKLEKEYALMDKEVRMRSDEAIKIIQQMENLEFEKKLSKR
jgi:recombinational DNA repair ATPase RecF